MNMNNVSNSDLRITFLVPSPEIKKKFANKASLEKGNMSTLLNEWVDAYLNNNLFSKNDVLILISLVLSELGHSEKITNIETVLNHILESSFKINLVTTPGKLLKKIRLEKNLSSIQEAISFVKEKTGVIYTKQNFSRIENQKRFPREKTIQPILQAYGYSYEKFVERFRKERQS